MSRFNVTFIFFLFILPLYGQQPSERADSLLSRLLPENEHAVQVLVAQGNDILYQKTLGYADRENKRMANEETIFRIGSITKQFTATAILKLAEMGKLALSDPLSKYIIDFPDGDKVTIHHLLTHTSGIKSYTDQPDFGSHVSTAVDEEVLMEKIKSLGYDFPPGEQWRYNNSGYFILGYLIGKISGMAYSKFLDKYVLKPAKMNHTGVYDNTDKHKNEALGYGMAASEISEATNWDMTWAGGAGDLYSTATDLYQWNNMLFAGKVISENSLAKAHSQVKLNDGSEYPYGYGWALSEFKGLKSIGHGGGLEGFLSYITYYPELDATIVVLSNCSPPENVVPSDLVEDLTMIFFKKHLKENEEVPVDYSLYNKYVGKYEYPGSAVMNITRGGDHLYGQLSGQARYEIFPKGDHQFFWKVVNAEITFHLNDEGMVDYAMHKQGGREFRVARMAERKEIALPEGTFARYSGEYSLSGTKVKVWEENGKYFTQVAGQPKFEIFPYEENAFFMKDIAVEIEFEAEGEEASSLIIRQGGQEYRADRL